MNCAWQGLHSTNKPSKGSTCRSSKECALPRARVEGANQGAHQSANYAKTHSSLYAAKGVLYESSGSGVPGWRCSLGGVTGASRFIAGANVSISPATTPASIAALPREASAANSPSPTQASPLHPSQTVAPTAAILHQTRIQAAPRSARLIRVEGPHTGRRSQPLHVVFRLLKIHPQRQYTCGRLAGAGGS